jgi:hypothetical protein
MNAIKFGNKKGLKINSTQLISYIENELKNKYNINDFSFDNYQFLNNNTKVDIKKQEYWFTLNTSGVKYFLFLFNYQNKNYCCFINRKNRIMTIVRFRFDVELFNGTLLEGELNQLDDNGNDLWYFLITDMPVYEGNKIMNYPIQYRFLKMNELINMKYERDANLDCCTFVLKNYFKYENMRNVYERINEYPFKVNGFLFKSNEQSTSKDILFIFVENRNKKIETNNTEEANIVEETNNTEEIKDKRNFAYLKCKKTDYPDYYELYCIDENQKEKLVDIACVPNLNCSKFIFKSFKKSNSNDLIFHCVWNSKFKLWEPLALINDVAIDKEKFIKSIVK